MLSVLRNHSPAILNWTSEFSTTDLYLQVLSHHCLHRVLEEDVVYTSKKKNFFFF